MTRKEQKKLEKISNRFHDLLHYEYNKNGELIQLSRYNRLKNFTSKIEMYYNSKNIYIECELFDNVKAYSYINSLKNETTILYKIQNLFNKSNTRFQYLKKPNTQIIFNNVKLQNIKLLFHSNTTRKYILRFSYKNTYSLDDLDDIDIYVIGFKKILHQKKEEFKKYLIKYKI